MGSTTRTTTRNLSLLGAASALGIGTVFAGIPAQAAPQTAEAGATSVSAQATLRGATSGAQDAAAAQASGDAVQQGAPVPFDGGAAAGGVVPQARQSEPGSHEFLLDRAADDRIDSEPALQGEYAVDAGDGVDGAHGTATVGKEGRMVLSQDLLPSDGGSRMLQVRGPLNPDRGTEGAKQYLDSHGQPTDTPDVTAGGVFHEAANATLHAGTGYHDDDRNAGTGLPVEDVGTTEVSAYVARDAQPSPMAQHPVSATFVDQETGEPRTVENVAELEPDPQDQTNPLGWTVKGEGLSHLKSGRYTLAFRDRSGAEHRMFLLLGDGQMHQGSEQLYAPVSVK